MINSKDLSLYTEITTGKTLPGLSWVRALNCLQNSIILTPAAPNAGPTGGEGLEAKEAGADFIGLDEYLQKIKDGWTDVDVIVTMPSVMGKLGPLGKVLGPRGLMPNPKTGTVTMDIKKAVTDVKGGKIDFKVDKNGIIHASIGKASFDAKKIEDNANELLKTVQKMIPSSIKGTYIKSIFMSSTMSPSIRIETKIA